MALKFNWLREICTSEQQQLLQVYWAFMLWWQQTQTFHAPRGKDVSTGELVHTIYMGKPEITVGKSNGLCHSIWSASENMGCDLKWCNVVCSADLDIHMYFVAVVLPPCQICLFLYMYKISTHQVVCVNGKHPGYTLNLLIRPSVSMLHVLICFNNMKASSKYFLQ